MSKALFDIFDDELGANAFKIAENCEWLEHKLEIDGKAYELFGERLVELGSMINLEFNGTKSGIIYEMREYFKKHGYREIED